MMAALALLLAQLAAPASAPAQPSWRLVWSDEFNGRELDRAKWHRTADCAGGGNHERQCYTRSARNLAVRSGKLVITARREQTVGRAEFESERDPGKPATFKTQEYSSAKITTETKADWRFGRFEVRARLPKGQGTWPAIWMLPSEWAYGKWAASGEIDILETVNLGAPCAECPGGAENRVLGTLHYGGVAPRNTHKGEELFYPLILDGKFHTFGLTWGPTQMEWSVDGRPFARRSADEWFSEARRQPGAPFDRPFYLILNLAVGGGLPESRDLKTVDQRAFPARFEVDYVRVWQADAASAGRP